MGCQFVCDHITAYCLVCTIRDLLKNRWTRQREGGGGGGDVRSAASVSVGMFGPGRKQVIAEYLLFRWRCEVRRLVLQLTSVYWRSRNSVVIASAVLLYSRIPLFKTMHFSVISFFISTASHFTGFRFLPTPYTTIYQSSYKFSSVRNKF